MLSSSQSVALLVSHRADGQEEALCLATIRVQKDASRRFCFVLVSQCGEVADGVVYKLEARLQSAWNQSTQKELVFSALI